MNREYKFRLWIKAEKKMVYGRDATAIPLFTPNFKYRTSEIELMQYIGLRDKNEKEIYEKDIVKDEKGKVAYVLFLQQEMGYVLVYGKYDKRLGRRNRCSNYDIDFDLEVIGNMAENLELFKKEVN